MRRAVHNARLHIAPGSTRPATSAGCVTAILTSRFNVHAALRFQSPSMMNTLRFLIAATTLYGATPSHADPAWDAAHPRRAEVNGRLANQNRRINEGVADHQLTDRQARQLHREDRAIRAEERADAAAHGGHITKAEQHRLNRQENRVSRQIHRERQAGK
jgi:hypothetical protein